MATGPGKPSVAIVGAGMGGIAAAAMLLREGYADITILDRGERVGGTWNFNRYPGLSCDVPSHLYEFEFAPNPHWTRRFAPGAEIRAYMEDVARRHGLLERVRLRTEVERAVFQDDTGRWRLDTTEGEHEADVLITACGQLATPRLPPIPGLEEFEGPAFHTARWRDDVELEGKRIALIGTGCSSIQVGPAIQPKVAQLDVYQRSPGWTLPKMDHGYPPAVRRLFERVPLLQRIDRAITFALMETVTKGLTGRRWLLRPLRALARHQIKRQIADPELRAKVTPNDELGCKRIMLTDDWYPTLTQPNVELVTDRIEAITPKGIRTSDGIERPADVLIMGTGFHTHGFVAPMEVVGRGGRTLEEAWAGVPRAYLGATVSGFPNMFVLYGPNTNGGAGSAIYTVECGARHAVAAIKELDRTGARTIELRPEAAEEFDRELRAALERTVWHTGCTSWYLDEQGNDPNQWPWTATAYRRRTERLDPAAYDLAA